MRILVLIHEFPPVGGGGGRVAQEVAYELVKRDHDVHVITSHIKGLPFQDCLDGVHVTRVPSFRRQRFSADLLAMSGYLIAGFFVGLLKIWQFKPDLIHVHFAVPAGALAWILSFITGVPYVLTTHLGDIPGGVPDKTERWFRWIYRFTPRIWRDAASVTAISGHTRHLALLHYPVDIRVIPNGINIDIQDDSQIHLNTPPGIVFAARFVEQKGPTNVPAILHALKDPDWKCILVGDGALKREVERQIIAFKLQDRVSFTGWISPEEVMQVLSRSDILLMPSRTEGIPIVGLQAVSTGLAIVGSRVGGVTELVEDGRNGFLHAPDDIPGFINSLKRLLTEPSLLLNARKASLDISLKFDLAKIAEEYEQEFIRVKNGETKRWAE
jgi:L-malate glycosyltransferase